MSFARGFMRWLAPIGGATQDHRVARDTPTASRFRVEPLEPRLLLSGDPLDLLKGSLERQLLQEPAVAVSDTASAPSPSIDWGGGVRLPRRRNIVAFRGLSRCSWCAPRG